MCHGEKLFLGMNRLLGYCIMAAVQEINGPDPDLFLSGLFLR